jgi:cell wall-associated NlpC family hydrolase
MDDRDLALKVAWHFLGTPYIWGGDDPSGFDCSGFVIECLQSVGVLPRKGDWSAAGLWDTFKRGRRDMVTDYKPGDLVFYVVPGTENIIHVEILVDQERSIGASGGGSSVVSTPDAWRRNSYVKVRPMWTREGIYGVLNPFFTREARPALPATA